MKRKQDAMLVENWEALIKWFDIVKSEVGVVMNDNFEVEPVGIQISGECLQSHMNTFWEEESILNKSEALLKFDLSNMYNRMRIKLHLVKLLDSPYF